MATLFAGGRPDTGNVPQVGEATEEERMRSLVETLSAYIEHYHGGAVEMLSYDGETLKIK
ncbi:MAG: hypothetical protein HY260_00815, partial [Chloroflexi bacterium]|nr:hypothetical protein [Chloroflexota bacterium]